MRRTSTSARLVAAPLIGFLAILLVLAAPLRSSAQQAGQPFMVVDRASGQVLMENRAFDRWYPASLTKLMTLYVTLRAIAAGELAAGSPVTMSKNAAAAPPSKTGYAPGTVVRVDTAMTILIVKSANDMAVALAESVAGSVPAFVERMNAEAARLGMNDSRFVNPSGLHNAQQHVSARDMALLSRQILDEFPQMIPVFAVPALSEGEKREYSYNLLLERFPGADGMKTGFVCASGYNIVASATRGGRQVIAVVFGADSQTDRAVEAARLLLQGFERQGGPALGQFVRSGEPAAPKNQTARMCSEQARKGRIDLQPEDMKIDSALLLPRTPGRAVAISRGGVDAPPAAAVLAASSAIKGRIPVPTPRPDHVRLDVDGEPAAPALRGSVPVPQRRAQ